MTFILIYLLGIVASSIVINLLDWWLYGYDIRIGDLIHPYHLLSWILIIVYLGMRINDWIEEDDNFVARFVRWVRKKILINKRNRV